MFENKLRCPICEREDGTHCVHPTTVQVFQGPRITTIGAQSVEDWVDPKGESHSGRGARIVINFWCEGGHAHSIAYQFHKGDTYLELIEHGAVPGDELNCPEMWRD
jgi:hypothetical protein